MMSIFEENDTFEEYANFLRKEKKRTWNKFNNNASNEHEVKENYTNESELGHTQFHHEVNATSCKESLCHNQQKNHTTNRECDVNNRFKKTNDTHVIYEEYINKNNNEWSKRGNMDLYNHVHLNQVESENQEIQINYKEPKQGYDKNVTIQNDTQATKEDSYNFVKTPNMHSFMNPSPINQNVVSFNYVHNNGEHHNNEEATSWTMEPNESSTKTDGIHMINSTNRNNDNKNSNDSTHNINLQESFSRNKKYNEEYSEISIQMQNEIKENEKKLGEVVENKENYDSNNNNNIDKKKNDIIDIIKKDINKKLDENDMLLHAINEHLENNLIDEPIPLFEHLQQNLFVLSILAKQSTDDEGDSSDDEKDL